MELSCDSVEKCWDQHFPYFLTAPDFLPRKFSQALVVGWDAQGDVPHAGGGNQLTSKG